MVWREPKEQREQSQVHLSTAESWLGKIKNQIVLLRGLASSQITENVIIICTRMCVRTIMILPALSGCITLLFVIYLLADACRPHLLFPITTIAWIEINRTVLPCRVGLSLAYLIRVHSYKTHVCRHAYFSYDMPTLT